MNMRIFRSTQKSQASNAAPRSAVSAARLTDRKFPLKSLIVVTGTIANGLILLYSVHSSSSTVQPSRPTVLPPVTEAAKAQHTADIEQHSKRLQTAHTQDDHLAIANALSHLGCRDAAAEQYEMGMAHDSTSHSHEPTLSCKPQ